ncbi:MAG TPA: IS4 family transposase, partial [Hanamia sp.]|nr:IS4 family transposase [Hanamia sp.]
SIFGAIYQELYQKYRHIISDSRLKIEIASKLYILDSSTVSLFKAILKPAGRKRNDGKSKGGMKVHTLLKADCNMPSFIKFTAAALHDQQFYQYIKELPDGSIITFDKAYINYEQFSKFGQRGIFYVIPQKDNAIYKSIKEFELSDDEPAILKDELIEVNYKIEEEGIVIQKMLQLRRIAYYSQKHHATFIYITNHFDIEAMQIVEIYKNRWQIEKFFKKLKQNFPLTYFLGDNINAIEIQIWCALIALMLLQVLHTENNSNLSFSILATIVRLHLMNYISITEVISHYKIKRQRKKAISPPPQTKKMTPPLFQIKFAF